MEGTATWMEDEVYDDGQRQPPVPRRSQLDTTRRPVRPASGASRTTSPRASSTARGSSSATSASSSRPELVRRIWEFADGTQRRRGPVLAAGGRLGASRAGDDVPRRLRRLRARERDRRRRSYEEGEAYPTPPLARSLRLRPGGHGRGNGRPRPSHVLVRPLPPGRAREGERAAAAHARPPAAEARAPTRRSSSCAATEACGRSSRSSTRTATRP